MYRYIYIYIHIYIYVAKAGHDTGIELVIEKRPEVDTTVAILEKWLVLQKNTLRCQHISSTNLAAVLLTLQEFQRKMSDFDRKKAMDMRTLSKVWLISQVVWGFLKYDFTSWIPIVGMSV